MFGFDCGLIYGSLILLERDRFKGDEAEEREKYVATSEERERERERERELLISNKLNNKYHFYMS